ncbi:MAG TPA: hypothetical protein VHX20_07085 [Terracidiphilus sp.]|jgi:hypothetical protein|nr:hypothetical protein [Terracidiphilus sp.]
MQQPDSNVCLEQETGEARKRSHLAGSMKGRDFEGTDGVSLSTANRLLCDPGVSGTA